MNSEAIYLIIMTVVAWLTANVGTIVAAVMTVKKVAKKVEDSTGLKKDLARLVKQNEELKLLNEELTCRLDGYALEMKGLKSKVIAEAHSLKAAGLKELEKAKGKVKENGYVRAYREIKK